jgi:hypothetical protein
MLAGSLRTAVLVLAVPVPSGEFGDNDLARPTRKRQPPCGHPLESKPDYQSNCFMNDNALQELGVNFADVRRHHGADGSERGSAVASPHEVMFPSVAEQAAATGQR